MRKLLNVLLAAAGVSFCTGVAAAAAVFTQAQIAPYLHPQRLVDVNGHRMNIYCTGHGAPAVILDAGAGYTTWTWRKVQPQIAKTTRVCSYDRAGMGFSDGAPLPRDASATVNDLHMLLHRADIHPPYVLVGHSIAGLYEPLFADRYPHEVAGMVLVDPSFPFQSRSLDAAAPALKRLSSEGDRGFTRCYHAAVSGTIWSGSDPLCGFPAPAALRTMCAKNGKTFCEIAHAQLGQIAKPAFWQDLQSESVAEDTSSSAENVEAQRSYGAMPLIVLTAANDNGDRSPLPAAQTKAMERAWVAGHDSIAHRSSVGVNFLVHQSGHFIQDDRPSVVISAITDVVEQARHQ
jgi:pimeloyl-ACP methyl ester carboxylesterase